MSLRWFAVLGLVFAAVTSRPIVADDEPAALPVPFRVVAYLPEYREFKPEAALGVTDLIVFSAEPAVDGGLDMKRLERTPWSALCEFKTRQGVRLFLCVGGGGRSANFPAMAASPELRNRFATEAVRVCLERRLDGLDLDWEHPEDAAEQEHYAELLIALREAFRPHGLALSVTMAAWQGIPKKGFEAVDWVNVMSYDHRGQHSTEEQAKKDVTTMINKGVPLSQITLGLPFYGRDVTKSDRVMTYQEIVAKYHPPNTVNEVDNIFFNGPDLVRRKCRMARDGGLAGIMVWELGHDAPGKQSLLKVITTTVNSKPRRP
ncbi:MAG: glycoside hydrolase family 18 protein [Planctomycetaceae bacterium]|nr:glycoside hydrolase family 18 protein [Planctomycetaceae bacterium]